MRQERRLRAVLVLLLGLMLGVGSVMPGPAQAAIAYVQSKNNSPNNSGLTTISAAFTAAQSVGNFNVVAIGWGSTTIGISSVTDSKGNTYTLAVGPTSVTGLGSTAIYYAKNIVAAAAGTNTVTVTFSAGVPFPDIRIGEYSGINTTAPLDVTATANGSSTSSDSGFATTTNANDLLIGSNWVASGTTGAGTGYTSRQISGWDGNILEDQIVTSTGAYNAAALISPSAAWIMQMAAFKAASSGADTTPPNPPTVVTASTASSSQINLNWSGATDNVGVTGYLIERCLSGTCTTLTPSGAVTNYSDTGLSPSSTYSYRVRATDAAGNISTYSTVTATAPTSAASIAYVQSKSTSQNNSAQLSVAATFSSAQVAGDLNVVAIGWGSTTPISSITDTKGNSYTLAVGPTNNAGVGTAAIYYAKNILAAAAGANTVTVTFSAAVPFPDIRIGEYSGISPTNPLDVTAVSTGTGTTSDSGSATTSNANDLLIGSNLVASGTTGAGTGYTSRQISGWDGDILEDQIVTSVGAYNATAPISPSAVWIMQMAAFKSAASGGGGGGGDTSPPGIPTAVGTTVVSSTQINLNWTAPTDNVGVTGYSIQRCQGSTCTTLTPSGTATTYSDTGLSPSTAYSYQIRATDAAGNWGNYSTAVSATTSAGGTSDTSPPSPPVLLNAVGVSSTQINLNWSASTDNVGVTGYQLQSCAGAGCNFASLGALTTNTTYSATGLTAGTVYRFRLYARDAAGNLSNFSNVLNGTTPTASGSTSSVTYDYDALGRLIETEIPSLGAVQVYSYDAAGNITSSVVTPLATLSIGGVSVNQASVGTQVTIYGSGFSSTAGADTVTFNGVSATVVSATATQLVVTVPSGAGSGPVSVSVGGTTVTSTTSFTASAGAAPNITGFSPTLGAAGNAISISGSNFDSTPANDVALFGAGSWTEATAASASSVTALVQTSSWSGPVRVMTPKGTAISTADFFVPPTGYTVATIGSTGRLQPNAPATISLPTAGVSALQIFSGTSGQRLMLGVTSVAIPSCTVKVFSPGGSLLTSRTVTANGQSLQLPALPATGTYAVVIDPATSTGSLALTLLPPLQSSVSIGGSPDVVTVSVPGQAAQITMSGTQGAYVTLALSGVSISSGQISVLNPDGSVLMSSSLTTSGLTFQPQLPKTGTYTILIVPASTATGSFTLSASSTAAASLSPNQNNTVSFSSAGTVTRTFAATQGQYLALGLAGIKQTGSGSSTVNFSVTAPNGTTLCSGSFLVQWNSASNSYIIQGGDCSLAPVAQSGTYQVQITSSSAAQLTVAVSTPQPLALDPSQAPATATLNYPGQQVALTFAGTQGQSLTLAATQTSAVTNNQLMYSFGKLTVIRPDGLILQTGNLALLAQNDLNATPIKALPLAGTYTVIIDPQSAATGTMAFTLSVPLPVGNVAFNNSTAPATLARAGQAVTFTFTGVAGGPVEFNANAKNSGITNAALTITSPSGLPVFSGGFGFGCSLYGCQSGICGAGPCDVVGNFMTPPLPETGTYTVTITQSTSNIYAQAGLGTWTFQGFSNVTGSMSANGSAVTLNTNSGVAVVPIIVTFAATAGQSFSVVISPSQQLAASIQTTAWLIDANGASVATGSASFNCGNAGCIYFPFTLTSGTVTQGGTYSVVVESQSGGNETLQVTSP